MTWLGITDSLYISPYFLYVMTRVASKFKRYLYPQCSNVFTQVRNICFIRSLRMGAGTIFKVGGHKCTSKKLENFCNLNWQLWHHKHWNMTSLTFVSMFKQVYSKFDKPSTTPICTTPYLSYTTLTWAQLVAISFTQKQFTLTTDPIRILLLI